jgi:FkbM family methyltransferase
MTGFRKKVRAWLPRPLWVLARRGLSYLSRLHYWGLVLIEIRGDGAAEAAKLYLSALAAPVTALPGLDEWRNPLLLFDARVRIAGTDRFHCRRHADDLFHVLPSGQGAVRDALAQHLHAGGVFVDAGANIGAFTVFGARRVGPKGKVVAFEMMPDTAVQLRRHLELNRLGPLRVIEAALSDSAGGEVVAQMPEGLAGKASIMLDRPGGTAQLARRVRTVTLDHELAGLDRIDVMKMDIEGAEALALAGGRAVLARTGCVIFESRDGNPESDSAARIVAEAGFRLSRLDGNNMIGFR